MRASWMLPMDNERLEQSDSQDWHARVESLEAALRDEIADHAVTKRLHAAALQWVSELEQSMEASE